LSPIVVEGDDLDEVYARACAIAQSDADRRTLVVHLDLAPDPTILPLPTAYPPIGPGSPATEAWLRDLVNWWQRDRSQLEHRIPYLHGARLRRYGGKIDQIQRIIRILSNKDSTRALAVLVDPFRDFRDDGRGEAFASFSLVEFRRREGDPKGVVDAIAFYRAQEFERWWPINVAELRLLQTEIAEASGLIPGRITTITGDARTISKSPTQVAMPIIDRWLDQSPERLHLIADALIHKAVRGDEQQKAIDDWHLGLDELREATKSFNSDGVPIAIEGLQMLAAYIRASASPDDDELGQIAEQATQLALHNEQYEATDQELPNFRRWAEQAKIYVDRLERSTKNRITPPS
jgi:hypothetical protein